MKRTRGRRLAPFLLVAVVSAVAAGAAIAGGQQAATVKVVKTADYGKVLATSSGMTLHHYTDETRGKAAGTLSADNVLDCGAVKRLLIVSVRLLIDPTPS